MTQPLDYQTTFILDKSHFNECYEESVQTATFARLYGKGLALLIVGTSLVLFSELNPYAAWFIFSLGVLELISTRYKKAWWVARQMLSKVAKAEVTLKMNADYIHISSFYNDNKMLFNDIEQIVPTANGWLITHNSVRHYIANRCLSEPAIAFLQSKT